jgi:colanic acid biosynthesis glycosyl transferase WcaI
VSSTVRTMPETPEIAVATARKQSAKLFFVNRYFHPDQSATSRLSTDLASRLAGNGFRVCVVTSRQLYDDPVAALPAHEVVEGVHVYRVATATRGRSRLRGRALDYGTFHLAAGFELMRRLSRGDIVVAQTDPPLISIVASHVARWRGAVLVNWLQDVFPEVAIALTPELLPPWLAARLTAARDRSLKRAALNVVLSESMRTRVASLGIEPARIRVVPNWADTANITPRRSADSVTRRQRGLSGRFVVGYSGNLGRAHEFETLVGASRLLRDEPRFAFLITGGGTRVEALKQTVAAAGLESFVFQSLQPAQLLADSLAASDVHLVSLLPPLEGVIVPSKAYGILAAGRPVIFVGDSNGDIARMIRDHECGLVVGVGESERLAEELRALSEDPARLELMGLRARELALARYTVERAVADWLAILQEPLRAVKSL